LRCLIAIDDSVAQVTARLQDRNLLNETLIVYMGDNGFMWGEHGLVDKRAMYEPSMRVPMIAHCPELIPKAIKPKEMVLNIDLAPTFLELAGVANPPKMHGQSLLPLMRGDAANWRKDFVYEYEWERDYPYTPSITGLRTEQYSLMLSHGLWDIEELYDIQKDPDQKNNLLAGVWNNYQRGRTIEVIKDPKLKALVTELQKRLAEILKSTGGDVRRAGEAIQGWEAAR
jgi:N-acetylglucosamine-6-sulfatase